MPSHLAGFCADRIIRRVGVHDHLHSIGMVESRREVGDQVAVATRDYLTSLACDVAQFAKAVREHWGVENALHWVLDVSFREDDCRIRKEKGAQNFAVLRHIALNLLQRESSHKRGVIIKFTWDLAHFTWWSGFLVISG